MRRWGDAWPGLLATLNGVGLCRFAYTPLIPHVIASGIITATGAAYIGAANVAGYLAGAAIAAPLAARVGLGTSIRINFIISIASIGACIWPAGFWWYIPWRFIAGAAGAVLMVLAPSYLLPAIDVRWRGRASGVIYTGVGAGIVLSSLIVPVLAQRDVAWAWMALTVAAAITAIATWPCWRDRGRVVRRQAMTTTRLTFPVVLVMLAFGMDGIGFIPHMLFWVDYIARGLGLGMTAGALQWLIFGIGALIGPTLGGLLGDRIGLAWALVIAFLLKGAAVFLPSFATDTPWLAASSVLAGAFTPGIAALSAARLSELVVPGEQTKAWGLATLSFGLFQAGGAYAMSFAYSRLGTYAPLYVAAGTFEIFGALFAYLALLIGRTARVTSGSPS